MKEQAKEMKNILESIEDPRHESYITHPLVNILILLMGAVVCGLSELEDMMTYFEKNKDFYDKHFLIKKIPSKPTFSRVLGMLDADKVGKIMIEVMSQHTEMIGDIIAFDGKAVRGSGEKGKSHSFLQILSAYATESGITLAQSFIEKEDKTNEIPVLRDMVEVMEVKGKTITADAMHCQRETCATIISQGGDYIFGIKNNQKELYEEVCTFLSDASFFKAFKTFETVEKNGGRIEHRLIRTSSNVSWIQGFENWSGLKTIFSITRIVTQKGSTTEETGYYLTSHIENPQFLLYATRSHWKIESMHWFLDVVFGEDNNGFESNNAHKVLNSIRKVALLAHKRYVSQLTTKKKPSIKQNVLRALLDENIALQVLYSFYSL